MQIKILLCLFKIHTCALYCLHIQIYLLKRTWKKQFNPQNRKLQATSNFSLKTFSKYKITKLLHLSFWSNRHKTSCDNVYDFNALTKRVTTSNKGEGLFMQMVQHPRSRCSRFETSAINHNLQVNFSWKKSNCVASGKRCFLTINYHEKWVLVCGE